MISFYMCMGYSKKKNKEISLDFSILSQIPHGLLRGETGASSGNF